MLKIKKNRLIKTRYKRYNEITLNNDHSHWNHYKLLKFAQINLFERKNCASLFKTSAGKINLNLPHLLFIYLINVKWFNIKQAS